MSIIQETLDKIKKLVLIERKIQLSRHTLLDYFSKGLCSYEDINYCIQNATTIHGIGKDMKGPPAVDGQLYKIRGETIEGEPFYTTGKFILNHADDEIYFFVTAHKIEEKK